MVKNIYLEENAFVQKQFSVYNNANIILSMRIPDWLDLLYFCVKCSINQYSCHIDGLWWHEAYLIIKENIRDPKKLNRDPGCGQAPSLSLGSPGMIFEHSTLSNPWELEARPIDKQTKVKERKQKDIQKILKNKNHWFIFN